MGRIFCLTAQSLFQSVVSIRRSQGEKMMKKITQNGNIAITPSICLLFFQDLQLHKIHPIPLENSCGIP